MLESNLCIEYQYETKDINNNVYQFIHSLRQQYGEMISVGIIVSVGGHVLSYSSENIQKCDHPQNIDEKLLGGYIDEIKDIPESRYGGSRKFLLDPSDQIELGGVEIGSFLRFFHKVCKDPDIKRSTQEGYLTTFRKLLEFAPKAEFVDIDYSFIQKFSTWLQREGCAVNTIAKHLKTIKRAVGHAIRIGYISLTHNPFNEFRIKQEKRPKRILTMTELKKLDNILSEGKLSQLEQEVLGAFLFGCYTGLRFSDLKKVTATDIKRINTRRVLTIQMQKTSKYINIPISELFDGRAITVLSTMGNRRAILFNLPSNSVANRVLARILKRVFKNSRAQGVSFHTARRTMATQLLSLRVPITTVQALLGHSSVKTTEVYAKVSDQTVLSDLRYCRLSQTSRRKKAKKSRELESIHTKAT